LTTFGVYLVVSRLVLPFPASRALLGSALAA
jgi:hypothetical protein